MTQFYKAPHAVQTGGVLYPAGEAFAWEPQTVTVEGKDVQTKPGENWEKVSPKEAAITETATNKIPDDADLEALPVTALKAVAYLRNVAGIAELSDADALKTAIRASYEPKL